MRLGRNTTILLIILLLFIGIAGTYYWMNWNVFGYRFFGSNQTEYSDDELKDYINAYINRQFGPGFQPSDIFVFSNTPYYISVTEETTGKGAFELLFDPDTKRFQPEPGPNMMWNQKYGMMGNSRGMGFGRNVNRYNYSVENQVSSEKAQNFAQQYLDENKPGVKVSNEGHDFYGYYTFHTLKDDKPVGMLSVNGLTGEVWYHDWHGELDHIIELEEHNNLDNTKE